VKVKGEPLNKTDLALGAAAVGLLIWEGWTLVNKTPKDTISERIEKAAMERPLVPFVFGMLCGHFFWQFKRDAPADVQINAESVEVKA
jgi:hypothetical protein